MLKTIPCRPQVYRRAAEIVAKARGFDDQFHTCLAINDAVVEFFPNSSNERLCDIQDYYKAQYKAVLGPFVDVPDNPVEVHCRFGYWARGGGSYREGHPFWNQDVSPDRQRIRTIALLLMADICEQGL